MKKIQSLTPEQEAYMHVFREEQRAIALKTEPINIERATAAINKLYEVNGLKKPEIHFSPSPKACLDLRFSMLPKEQRQKQDRFQSIWFVGGLDKFWVAFYMFGRHIGVEYTPDVDAKLLAYNDYTNECHITFMYNGIVFASDRPELYSFDANRRLHNENGPALRYRDGYSLYAWKGIRLSNPKLIEEKHKMTTKQIMKEQNAELRRTMIEIYTSVHGPGAIIKDMNAQKISEDMQNGFPRTIYQIGEFRFVHVFNGSLEPDGTRKEYFLGTQSENPHEAIATSYGRPTGKYKEAVRT